MSSTTKARSFSRHAGRGFLSLRLLGLDFLFAVHGAYPLEGLALADEMDYFWQTLSRKKHHAAAAVRLSSMTQKPRLYRRGLLL